MAGHGGRINPTLNDSANDREIVFPLSTNPINGWRNIITSFTPFGSNENRRTLSVYARRLLTNNGNSQSHSPISPNGNATGLAQASNHIPLIQRIHHTNHGRYTDINHMTRPIHLPRRNHDVPEVNRNTVIDMDDGSASVAGSHSRRQSLSLSNDSNETTSSNAEDGISSPSPSSSGSNNQGEDDADQPTANEPNVSINGESLTEILERFPELRNVWKVVWQYFVFILIIFMKLIYDRFASLFIVLVFTIGFIVSNRIVKSSLSNPERLSIKLTLAVWTVLLSIPLGLYVFYHTSSKKIYYTAFLLPTDSHFLLNLGELLWIVLVTDFVLKLSTVFIKGLYNLVPECVLRYRYRGKHMAVIEYTSQLYRSLAPVQPWLSYLLDNYTGIQKVFGVFLSALYMLSKGPDIIDKVRNFLKIIRTVWQTSTYGNTPSKSQLRDSGSVCPICQDDYVQPIRLHCEHIFCEPCVARWFDRERNCPMCRTKVADDPRYKDGSTAFALQLY